MSEKILITGGCGFIGVNLIEYLLAKRADMDITVFDNLSTGKLRDIERFGVKFIEGDIRDQKAVGEAMSGINSVAHLAADTRVIDSIVDPGKNYDVNVNGTFNLLMQARKHGVSRFVSASTGGAILGDVVPPVHEDMVPRPVSPYGASKLCAEAYLSAFGGAYGLKSSALRFSNVYGPWSYHKGSVVAQIFKRVLDKRPIEIFGDGSQTRDFIFVRDIASAVYLALTQPDANGVFQIGTGKPTSLNELIGLIKEVVGDASFPELIYHDFRTGEIVHTHSKVDHAREKLGFSSSIPLIEGLRETWEWFMGMNRYHDIS